MVIYWDILLCFNLVVNSLILFLTSIAVGVRASWYRILLGAMLGAVYVVTSEFSVLMQEGLGKGALSFLIVAVVFGCRTWRTFLFRCAVFYLVSFAVGGAVLGWSYWWQARSEMPMITLGEVSGGVLIGAAAVFFCLRRTMERAGRRSQLARVQVFCGERHDAFCGLLDSGNLLAASVRRTPVIVAERAAVPSLVGEAGGYFAQRDESAWVRDFSLCEDELWQSRVVVQPYRTLGGAGQLLIGVRVDAVVIETDGIRHRSHDCIVAVTDKALSSDGTYAAIVPTRLLSEGEIEEGKREWIS